MGFPVLFWCTYRTLTLRLYVKNEKRDRVTLAERNSPGKPRSLCTNPAEVRTPTDGRNSLPLPSTPGCSACAAGELPACCGHCDCLCVTDLTNDLEEYPSGQALIRVSLKNTRSRLRGYHPGRRHPVRHVRAETTT